MANHFLKTSVIGIGTMAQTIHLPMIKSLKDRLTLNTIVDPYINENELRKLSNQYECQWSRNIGEVESDLVVVVTPITNHFEAAQKLIEKNKLILIEKPITYSLDNYNELLGLKNSNKGKRIFCGHMRRFYKNNNIAHKAVNSGLLGNIKEVKIYEGNLYGWNRKYYFDQRDAKKKNIDEGVLFDVGSHSIDSFTYIFSDHLDDVSINKSIVDDPEFMSNISFNGEVSLSNQNETVKLSASFSNTTSLANVIWIKGEIATLMVSPNDSVKPKIKTQNGNDIIELNINWNAVNPFYLLYDNIIKASEENMESVLDIEKFLFTTKILDAAFSKAKSGEIEWIT